MYMNDLQLQQTYPQIAQELEIDLADVNSYFRNYYINRFFPIRDLRPEELSMVKYYEELKYASATETMTLCNKYGINYATYLADRWLVPKAMVMMPDDEYLILKRYARLILEPFLNYKNMRAPRFRLLSKEEIAMLLSNIATGTSILPGEQISVRTSMEAMDRLLEMYATAYKTGESEIPGELKELSPAELVKLIELVKITGQGPTKTVVIDSKPKIKKNTRRKKDE